MTDKAQIIKAYVTVEGQLSMHNNLPNHPCAIFPMVYDTACYECHETCSYYTYGEHACYSDSLRRTYVR